MHKFQIFNKRFATENSNAMQFHLLMRILTKYIQTAQPLSQAKNWKWSWIFCSTATAMKLVAEVIHIVFEYSDDGKQ